MNISRNMRLTAMCAASLWFSCNSGLNDEAPVTSVQDEKPVVYVFAIRDNIDKPSWRVMKEAFEEASEVKADVMILHLNTYGGLLNIADSMRTRILNSHIPVYAFIDNQAISAGALIAIACDSIYMRRGGNIGAATVVDQTGAVVPDKYQSFMRATMRATAESHGKDTVVAGSDTILVWHRDPHIAEAMVDPSIVVTGIDDSSKVLTFTAEEALVNGYCERIAESIPEVLEAAGISEYELREYKPTATDRIIGFLLSSVVQGILIMVMIGGIYFELQTPGVGFPLVAALSAALLYFAPLYLEGLAANWEILLFIGGLVLVMLEVFFIPGFGVAGISGIVLIVTGLTLSLVDNMEFQYEGTLAMGGFVRALFTVVIAVFLTFILVLFGTKRFASSKSLKALALDTVQDHLDGYISIDVHQKDMIGKKGTAFTVLRPSGRVEIDGEIFDARAEVGYIEKGEIVRVTRDEAGQVYVIRVQ